MLEKYGGSRTGCLCAFRRGTKVREAGRGTGGVSDQRMTDGHPHRSEVAVFAVGDEASACAYRPTLGC